MRTQAWLEANSSWLRPYATFCLLRDLFQSAEHWEWGALGAGRPETVARLTAPGSDHYVKVSFTYWVQYHLHLQLKQVGSARHCGWGS